MSKALDRLAKRLADASTRRDILKALGGFLAGTFLLGFSGKAGADDDDPDDDDRDDVCRRYCHSCRHARCGAYRKCLRACHHTLRKNPSAVPCGTCTATAPFTACTGSATCCNGSCVNLDSTSTCGTTCQNAVSCGSGDTCCSGVCTNFTAAATCGTACGNTTACASPTPDCCSGSCTDLSSDKSNCGTCGTACTGGATCCPGWGCCASGICCGVGNLCPTGYVCGVLPNGKGCCKGTS